MFPQLENLTAEAVWFADRDCIVNLGLSGGFDAARLEGAINALLDSAERRRRLSEMGQETIDAQGMRRAAAAIYKRFEISGEFAA